MMNLPQNEFIKNVLIAGGICLLVHLFLNRSMLLFLPVFAAVLFLLWKRGGGRLKSSWQDDDPADWWKKGKRFGER